MQLKQKASDKTRMKIIQHNLHVNEEVVLTLSLRDAFVSFLYFLKLQRKPCILVAHNGFRFDAPRIIKLVKSLGLFNNKEDIKDAHNAWNDVMLQKLIEKLNIKLYIIIQHRNSISFMSNATERKAKLRKLQITLAGLDVSENMKNKIATAGISKSILQETCAIGGINGLTIWLGINVNGKPRVTKNINIIQKLFHSLNKTFFNVD